MGWWPCQSSKEVARNLCSEQARAQISIVPPPHSVQTVPLYHHTVWRLYHCTTTLCAEHNSENWACHWVSPELALSGRSVFGVKSACFWSTQSTFLIAFCFCLQFPVNQIHLTKNAFLLPSGIWKWQISTCCNILQSLEKFFTDQEKLKTCNGTIDCDGTTSYITECTEQL